MRAPTPGCLITALIAAYFLGIGALVTLIWIGAKDTESPQKSEKMRSEFPRAAALSFKSRAVGAGWTEEARPWVSHVNTIDLDGDGRKEIIVCDAQANAIYAITLTSDGRVSEHTLAEDVRGPARAHGADFDQDGDMDLLVASMGVIFPQNDKIGSVVLLENEGNGTFLKHTLIENIARVTDVRAADFDGDGLMDLVVGQFGYFQGEIRWMRNRGDGTFESEILLDLAGTVHVPIADFDRDGDLDFAALVTQEHEEVYLFRNDGTGTFTPEILWGSTNEDYGSSGMVADDLDQDGWVDLIITNGDGFDYATPGPRAWHGVQWLRNEKGRNFGYSRIGRLRGAYGPTVEDFNGDGYLDVMVCSWFNDWSDPAAVSLRVFLNNGAQSFTPLDIARRPTHLVNSAVLDYDGDGDPDLATGGFHAFPPFEKMSRVTLWTNQIHIPE